MLSFLFACHVFIVILLILLILLQQGKGADVGASFGSGASNTMFGSQGSMSFLSKLTGVLAALFFTTSISLSYVMSHQHKDSLLNRVMKVDQIEQRMNANNNTPQKTLKDSKTASPQKSGQ